MLIIVYKVQEEAALSIVAGPIVASTTAYLHGFHSTMTFTSEVYITKVGSANQKIESHEFFLRLLQYVGCAEVFLKPP